jgi:hypothetical protein
MGTAAVARIHGIEAADRAIIVRPLDTAVLLLGVSVAA